MASNSDVKGKSIEAFEKEEGNNSVLFSLEEAFGEGYKLIYFEFAEEKGKWLLVDGGTRMGSK